jgi:DNA-binding transcriptional regulator YiaG
MSGRKDMMSQIINTDEGRRAKLRLPLSGGQTSAAAEAMALREHLGLSREKFADLLGMSWQSVKRWEEGRSEPGAWFVELFRIIVRTPRPNAVALAHDIERLGPVPVLCELIRRAAEKARS